LKPKEIVFLIFFLKLHLSELFKLAFMPQFRLVEIDFKEIHGMELYFRVEIELFKTKLTKKKIIH